MIDTFTGVVGYVPSMIHVPLRSFDNKFCLM